MNTYASLRSALFLALPGVGSVLCARIRVGGKGDNDVETQNSGQEFFLR